MNTSPGSASTRRSFLNTKVIAISLIVMIIGVLTLLLEFFSCQSEELLSQWNIDFYLGAFGTFYLFFLVLFLWPFWWSIYSDKKSSKKNISVVKISLLWAITLFFPWFYGVGMFGVFFDKLYIFSRWGSALIALNYSFWKQIKPRERKSALIPWGISSMICLAIFSSESPEITPNNFNSKLSEFEAVVALVDSGKLTLNNNGDASLPCRYSHLANRGSKFNKGSIRVTKEGEAKIIQFRQKNFGFGDGSIDFVYRSDNKDMSPPDKPLRHRRVIKLKDHWFWQTLIY